MTIRIAYVGGKYEFIKPKTRKEQTTLVTNLVKMVDLGAVRWFDVVGTGVTREKV